jgi:hypothetical protein
MRGIASCFTAGTPVLTPGGPVAIESIRPGDTVLATDPATGACGARPVLRTFESASAGLVRVAVRGEAVSVTPAHPFYAEGRGWVPAGSLSAGDALLLAGGGSAPVEGVGHIALEAPVPVYNLEVAERHTYHVGGCGVLVHNKCDLEAGRPGSPEWRRAVKAIREGKGKGIDTNVQTVEEARQLIREARPELIEYTDKGEYYMRTNKIDAGFELHQVEPDYNKDLPHIKWKDWSQGKAAGAEGHIFIHGGR